MLLPGGCLRRQQGSEFVSTSWADLPYEDPEAWRAKLMAARKELEALVDLGRQLGIQAGFHNHSDLPVGGAL